MTDKTCNTDTEKEGVCRDCGNKFTEENPEYENKICVWCELEKEQERKCLC